MTKPTTLTDEDLSRHRSYRSYAIDQAIQYLGDAHARNGDDVVKVASKFSQFIIYGEASPVSVVTPSQPPSAWLSEIAELLVAALGEYLAPLISTIPTVTTIHNNAE